MRNTFFKILRHSKMLLRARHPSESWNPALALQRLSKKAKQKLDSSFRWNDEQKAKALDSRFRGNDERESSARRGVARDLKLISLVIGALALLIGLDAHAAATAITTSTAIPTLTVAQVGSQSISLPLQILALMSAITLLPAILLSTTAFTRVVIVFGLLRQALGTGQTPSNQILIGLSLFLTALIMAPVAEQAWTNGIAPYMDGKLDFTGAWQGIITPLRSFMLAQVRDNDLLTFAGLSGAGSFSSPADVPLPTLVASFLTSELKTAFEIGFLLYIPFVIIDLVVSSVLMSMGMMMLSPMLISAPFKILLFVLIDGWTLVVGSLASSFHPI